MLQRGTSITSFAVVALAVAGCLTAAQAAFNYPGCPDVVDADFKLTTLNSYATDRETSEPLKMDFSTDAQGNVDVYFTQRFGLLRKYSNATRTVTNIHKFTLATTASSDGLQGIALDPAFKSNGWIYLFYSGSTTEWRVSRFTIAADKLDPASEKILLRITEQGPSQHPGGALAFDWEGNLWITTGDNNKPIYAGNTNDLRGKILRIKPTPEGTYTVPKGNLFAEGTAKTRSEIYVMGSRNPYTLSLDPIRKTVTWGDVGPDAGLDTEEHNVTKVPGNFGWPYFAGANVRMRDGGTPEQPINDDGSNTGLRELPPAIPALHSYKQNCAVTGPVYYYDGANKSSIKFPPHFNGAYINADFGHDTVTAMALNADGSAITARMRLFRNMKFDNPLEFKMGPDGALYVINYAGYRSTSAATGLYRVEYTGTCLPETSVNALARSGRSRAPVAALRAGLIDVSATGPHEVDIQDMGGRMVARHAGRGPAKYALETIRQPGIYFVTVTADQGRFRARFVRP